MASASSVMKVARFLCASSSEAAAYSASGQPAVFSWLRARATSRSATATICMPAVSRACDRNMVPNLPAPMTPTVTGRPAASRSSNLACRFTGVSPDRFVSAKPKHKRAAETSALRAAHVLADYWQSARETKVSVWQPGPLLRPARQDLRRADFRPWSCPCFCRSRSLLSCTARWRRRHNRARRSARTGIFRDRRSYGRSGSRATASAASLAPSTVVLAAMPASWPKFSTFLPASLKVELRLSAWCPKPAANAFEKSGLFGGFGGVTFRGRAPTP